MRNFLPYILLSLLVFQAFSSRAQIQVEAQTDKKKIFLGDQFRLNITVSIPAGMPLQFVQTDSLPHFEKIETGKLDTTTENGLQVLKQELVLTSFDSGRWAIPPFSIPVGELVYRSDSIPMEVTYSPNGIPKEYHDIKDIQEVKGDVNWLFWISGILSLIALVVIFFWWRRNRLKHPAIKRYEHLSPYEEAMKLLNDLEAEEVPVKERYTRLTYIFRIFLKRKFKWNSFGKTTYELLLLVEKTSVPQNEYLQLAQTLRLCNLVKFAKYEPQETEHRQHIETIRTTIKSLNNES